MKPLVSAHPNRHLPIQPEAHELWLTALRAAGRRPTTLFNYGYATNQLAEWRGNPDLLSVSKFEALRFVQTLTDRYQPGGVRNRVKALRNFYTWAIREELTEVNPFKTITIRVPEEAQPTADEEAIEAMLASAKYDNRRDHALITLLVDTGARKDEVAKLELGDIDLRSGTVTFRVSKTRPRTVPLTDRAVISLSRWMKQRNGYPRPDSLASLWAVGDPYSLVKAAVRRHSNGQITPHQLRRAFAIRWLMKGGSETSLMRVCGWSSRAMVLQYTRASADVIAHDEFKRLFA